MSSLLLLLLVTISMHACNGRHLGVISKEKREVHLLMNKVVEKTDQVVHKVLPSVETAKELLPQVLSEEDQEDSKGTSGSEIKVLSSHEDLQVETKATKTEGWKKHYRVMLGSAPHDAEETVDSKQTDTVEDVVVMDYAQPHRKPPIHNKDP